MRTNLLPRMQRIALQDKSSAAVHLQLNVLQDQDRVMVFMEDVEGRSALGRCAGILIEQLVERLKLDPENTEFYRHIFADASGSLFGRFHCEWKGRKLESYRFLMLNNISEIKQLQADISIANVFPIPYMPAAIAS